MSRTLILTHSDLDGMVSGILLLAKLGCNAEIRITNGSKLAQTVRLELASTEPLHSAYISDLPLDMAHADETYYALEALCGQGTSLHLYDHHKGWNHKLNSRFRSLFTTYIVDENKTTAAALVWYYFLNRDREWQRWLELLSKKDSSSDSTVADDFRLLAALMQPRYANRKSDMMRCLASGTNIADRCEILRWYVGEHLPRERSIAEQASIFETKSGHRIGWLDLRHETGFYPSIGKLVMKHHSVDLVATIIRSGVLLGGASIDRGIDLSFLHGCHSIDGVGIEVVGHKSPVRLRAVDGVVNEEFIIAAKSLIIDRI